MKLALALAFLWPFALPVPVYADVFSVSVDASQTTIPAVYDLTSASRVIRNIRGVTGIIVANTVGARIALNCSGADGTVPSATSNHNIYVPATNGFIAIDSANLGGTCFLECPSGAQTSGIVDIMLIGG